MPSSYWAGFEEGDKPVSTFWFVSPSHGINTGELDWQTPSCPSLKEENKINNWWIQ